MMESRVLHSPSSSVAWVTLVFGLDLSYISGALVLASALRRQGTCGDLVCMVTPDVPQESRTQLMQFFDLVVEVPYLMTLALQKQSSRFDACYSSWLDRCFTKFALFGLVEYEKIVFLDADMLPLEGNFDVLFQCPTPAGICSSVKGRIENEKLHGVPLPRLVINESLRNGHGHHGVHGCLLIFKPDLKVYTNLRQMVEEADKYGSMESSVAPDELMITKYFINDWHHVHVKYGWVSWADRKDLGVDPCILHYIHQKPWADGQSWDDFKYWNQEAKEVVKCSPQTLVYFSHAAKTIAEMSDAEFTPELELRIKQLQQISLQCKTEERNRRFELAEELNIDLRQLNKSTVLVCRRTGDFTSPPKSARATVAPRNSPSAALISPPNSARGANESSKEPLLVKVSPNILIINGYKRPAGAKPKLDPNSAEASSNEGANGSPVDIEASKSVLIIEGTKPSVPKLNLQNVNFNEDGLSHNLNSNGQHWKKHSSEVQSSRADMQLDWRPPSGRSVSTPMTQNSLPKSQSARNWKMTGNKFARRKEFVNHSNQTPKSSRADLSSCWRSTTKQDLFGGDWKAPGGSYRDY
eukprot:g4735.t1